jgi:hypothetical protein
VRARPIRRWTLRELINGSERVCREITEHLNTDCVPAVREVGRLLKPHKHRKVEVSDKTVANAIVKLEKAEAYATDLINQLEEILTAVHSHAEREVS